MRTDAMSKLTASFFVLVMALSALAFLPATNTGQTTGTNTIYVPVVSDGSPVSTGVTVTLTDVHTGETVPAPYSSAYNLYVATNAPSGYYRVDVAADGYYDKMDAAEFRFEGLTSYTVSPQITLDAFAPSLYTWNVTVRDDITNLKIIGAKVSFYDPAQMEIVATSTTNSLGYATVEIFESLTIGDLDLIVQSNTYRMYVEPVVVSADNETTIYMEKSVRVTGFVTDYDGPASNVVAYLLSNDTGLPWIQRLQKSDMGGSFFAFDSIAGDYILCVDADGVKSYMDYLTVSSTAASYALDLENQTQRLETTTMTYGSDFSSFSLAMSTVLSYDDAIPGMDYSDVGSLRMQIDLNSDANGAVDAGEIAAFQAKMSAWGPTHVTSSRLLQVNDTIYKSATSLSPFALTMSAGLVTATAGVPYSYTCTYTAVEAIDVGADDYTAVAYAAYDTASVNYSFAVDLPADYELVANTTTSHVSVTGYLVFLIQPNTWTGGPEAVSLMFEKSEMPSAGAGIVDTNVTYAVTDEGGNVTKYYVKAGSEFNFTAIDSFDPNGNPLTYIWEFADGSSMYTTGDVLAAYTYTDASALYVVNMTVADVAGLENLTTINVTVDGLGPVAVITVENLTAESDTIRVDQAQLLTLNGTSSSDDAVTVGDGLGLIDYVEFSYGDGNESGQMDWQADQQNVTHAYERSGTYTLYMNATDVVGHVTSAALTVEVNDTSAPAVTFTAKNETWGTSLVENKTVTFDANASTDNVDELADMYYVWYFGDDLGTDSWLNGTGLYNVTHNFTTTGNFAVKLNITDLENNSAQYTKRVTIVSGLRPDVRIDAITFDPEEFTEGSAGYIVVNLTNRGSAVATDVVVTFYMQNADGTETLIGSTSSLLNGTTAVTTIAVGDTVQVKFSWTPDSKGTYTIKVNVTSYDQLTTHDMNGDIVVKEAGWKKIALWGGVAAVIVLVPLLLLLRGRWSKREKKGPRREKDKKTQED